MNNSGKSEMNYLVFSGPSLAVTALIRFGGDELTETHIDESPWEDDYPHDPRWDHDNLEWEMASCRRSRKTLNRKPDRNALDDWRH